ncbi:MAG: Putative peptidase, partial [uncultured Cytophagales bacterium]
AKCTVLPACQCPESVCLRFPPAGEQRRRGKRYRVGYGRYGSRAGARTRSPAGSDPSPVSPRFGGGAARHGFRGTDPGGYALRARHAVRHGGQLPEGKGIRLRQVPAPQRSGPGPAEGPRPVEKGRLPHQAIRLLPAARRAEKDVEDHARRPLRGQPVRQRLGAQQGGGRRPDPHRQPGPRTRNGHALRPLRPRGAPRLHRPAYRSADPPPHSQGGNARGRLRTHHLRMVALLLPPQKLPHGQFQTRMRV